MQSYRQLASFVPRWRGIFCDVDDTLTHDGALVPAAYDALARAAAAGLRVVAVTGRPAGWAEVFACTWPLDGAIAENGAFAVRRRGRSVEHLTWDDGELCRAHQRQLHLLADVIMRDLPEAKLAEDQWLRRCDVAFDIGETQQLPRAIVDDIVGRVRTAGANVVISSVHAHAFFGDHDKAKMCARVAQRWWNEDLDATRGDYLFVGDSPNDQACFAYFPMATGVANVRRYLDRLAPPPTYVTDAEGGHGFGELVSFLLGLRGA